MDILTSGLSYILINNTLIHVVYEVYITKSWCSKNLPPFLIAKDHYYTSDHFYVTMTSVCVYDDSARTSDNCSLTIGLIPELVISLC